MDTADLQLLFSLKSIKLCLERLFPNIKTNRLPTNIVGLYHILGAAFIFWGVVLPPKYLYIHILVTSFMLFTYYIFRDKCFVTMISNFLCHDKNTDPLILPISKFKNIIYIILILSIMFYTIPNLSLYNILFTANQ